MINLNIKLIDLFRIHCFNNYRKNKDCIDFEITFYIECTEKDDGEESFHEEDLTLGDRPKRRRRDVPIICQQESRNTQTTATPFSTEQLTYQPEDSSDSTRTFHINMSYQIFVTFLKKLSQTDFSRILGVPATVNISGPP